MKGTVVLGAAIGLLTLLGGVAVAASGTPSSDPDPEDCEDLQDQLAAQTSARNDMQQQRAALLAAAQNLPIGSDEELLAQVAELDGMIANMNQQIAATNNQLAECG